MILIIRRPAAYRQSFEKIYTKALNKITSSNNQNENHIHGSLLTFGELLRVEEFMKDKFDKICTIVLQLKVHKSKHIKNAVLSLLPKLAAFKLR